MMRYLVITKDPCSGEQSAFYTKWFDAENHFNPEYGMIVVDMAKELVTFDGVTWKEIEYDHL